MTSAPRPRAERVYARLLRLFTPAFRSRFEPDLLDLFRDKHRAAAARGRAALAIFWIRIAADVVTTAARRELMTGLLHDIRHSARVIARRPAVSAVIVITLALGIGANTAIFSLVNTVLLRPLPYADADRLVQVWEQNLQRGRPTMPIRPANFFDWRSRATSFEDVAWSRDGIFNLSGEGEPESLLGYRFSANMFSVLGVQPVLGRAFNGDDDKPGAPGVVILSDKLWRRRFNADPGVLARAITLNGRSYQVVGVMPAAFNHPQGVELWTPVALTPEQMGNRRSTMLRLVGKLKPGVTRERAQAELEPIYRELEGRNPDTNTGLTPSVVPFGGTGDAKPLLLVLLAGVGFVLLIACANVANLLLADAAGRRRELAVRSALGASRLRVARQMLTESLMLSMAGGALGALVTWWTRDALLVLFPENIANLNLPRVEAIDVDGWVFAFAFGTSIVTGLIFGTLPAWTAARASLQGSLKDGDRGGSASRRTHAALVVAEVALSVVLLAGALLMVQSFVRLQRGALGFEPDRVMSARVLLPAYRYPDAASAERFMRELLPRLRAIPGVESAGATNFLPLSGWSGGVEFTIEGRPEPPAGQAPNASFHVATDDYFTTMGIPIVSGRAITARDNRSAPNVVVINQALASRHWPGENPVGRRVVLQGAAGPLHFEIAGVSGDVRTAGLEEPLEPQMYFSFWQDGDSIIGLVLRTHVEPASVSSQIQQAVWSIDPDQPVTKLLPMKSLAAESLAFRRAGMTLAGAFGVLALVLSAIGIYGVLSYSVSRRTREIGIRVALGATRTEIARVVLKEGLAMTLAGVAIGLGAALALTHFLSGMLYGVTPRDPATLASVVAGLIAIALVSAWLPARRATAVDPVEALRA